MPYRMTRTAIVKLLVVGMLSSTSWVASAQPAAPQIAYKQTPINSSEARFLRDHRDQGFLCGPNIYGQPGRQCESEKATYSGRRVAKTTAYFLSDKLIHVSVALPTKSYPQGPSESDMIDGAQIAMALEGEFESRFGSADEMRWPEQIVGLNLTTWSKTWKRAGNALNYRHALHVVDGKMIESWNVEIYSIAGRDLFADEQKKRNSNSKKDI